MLAIVAAVIFLIALLLDLTEASIGIATGTIVTAGLLCLALHLGGVGSWARSRSSRWSYRR
ncbi:MAG TPA: hypothetical protein VFV67_13960 [Actinophytocola sp.]|uniref:hypothetical protein n=1 Tax=Actinophytocola sp. TaxID=1872138 RepID=UPI002DBCE7AA|nr:hypothetical protein [Actinophytocola sp.]HEU5471752.1 hypothetical protein [Actinophytocola sp.]